MPGKYVIFAVVTLFLSYELWGSMIDALRNDNPEGYQFLIPLGDNVHP